MIDGDDEESAVTHMNLKSFIARVAKLEVGKVFDVG